MPDGISSWLSPESLTLPVSLFLGTVPAAIARARGQRLVIWWIYGVAAALFAWPLIVVPTVHVLLSRPRLRLSTQDRERQRRSDALALINEPSMRAYPSCIKQLRRLSPAGVDRRRYVHACIRPGDALELVREAAAPRNRHATAYYHRGVHLGYLPRKQSWVAEALDDGLRFAVIVEDVRMSWFRRRRARSVQTRLIMFSDGH